jgi:HSP20 family protein
MAIVRFDPLSLDRFFGTALPTPRPALRRWLPALDVVEQADGYLVRADLPGLGEDDVSIAVENDVLTVSGERKSEHEESKEGYRRIERAFGSFSRSLRLPEGVDADAVSASFEKGVLEISIPKPEARKPRRVEITAKTAA